QGAEAARRDGRAAHRLRLLQPDHAGRGRQGAARAVRLRADPRQAGGHVPAHAARRGGRLAGTRRSSSVESANERPGPRARARGWVYVPTAPLRRDSPLLAHGTDQRTGHGFALTLAGHRCLLYEHVRVDGSGRSKRSTSYVVLVVDALLPDAVALRIRARHAYA